MRFGETLFLAGMIPSIGSVGDAFDNALCETIIGLYKTEAIRADSPFRNGPIETIADLEEVTSAWVNWYNNHRLMYRLGRIPPAEHEANWSKTGSTRIFPSTAYSMERCMTGEPPQGSIAEALDVNCAMLYRVPALQPVAKQGPS